MTSIQCRGAFITERTQITGASVLDVGCGGGILSEYLALAGAKVTGIDANEDLIEVARLHATAADLDIRYECVGIEDLAAGTEDRFDIITCMELLEHVPDPKQMVDECARRLSATGDIFFSTNKPYPQGLCACRDWGRIPTPAAATWDPRLRQFH